ncbi:unnamed protein product, partial [Chrysoparadoxa australica]
SSFLCCVLYSKEAEVCEDLADAVRAEGRFAEAEELYRRAVGVWEKAVGLGHPDAAHSINNLGAVLFKQGGGGAAPAALGDEGEGTRPQ